MPKRSLLQLFSLTLFATSAFGQSTPTASAADADITGIWQGILDAGAAKLRIVFHIKKNDEGQLTTTMDSPDQGAKDIPVSETDFAEGKLKLTIAVVRGSYEGTFNDDHSELTGTWSQGGMSLPLALKRVDRVEERKRPQNPTKPYPYDEVEVEYDNAEGKSHFAGTLTLPRGDGPFPAALLITGSGQQDRDEALMGHKPFLVLADHLTRNGIAVLRVDDRGIGGSTGDVKGATSADFATDVAAGVKFLQQQKRIDKTKVGLIGHSEGGLIAPMVAAKNRDVAFVVLMAGPGVPGADILREQLRLLLEASGEDEESIESESAVQDVMLQYALADEKESAEAKEKADAALRTSYNNLTPGQREAVGAVDDFVTQKLNAVDNAWMRYFVRTDPRQFLGQVRCPVLAINGEKDLQVPPQQNLPEIEKALQAGGNKDVTTRELPGLNHLFQTATTGHIAEYAQIEETMSPEALTIMSEWILARTK